MSKHITIQLEGDKSFTPNFQKHNGINKIIGTVNAKNFAKLISTVGLTANPRKSKIGKITKAIEDTLINDPEMFVFRSKGLLLATHNCKSFDRNRFNLSFEDPSFEGVLDGGHTMLAIGLHILNEFGESPLKLRRVKRWDDFLDLWNEQDLDEIKELLDSDLTKSISVPVEILSPTDDISEEDFKDAIYDISEARNTNVSLKDETLDDHKGYFNPLKEALSPEINNNVEWKDGDKDKSIGSKDIIAMSLIPFFALEREGKLPGVAKINPVNIYSSKAKCIDAFRNIIEVEQDKTGQLEITDPLILSAFNMLNILPKLFDDIYVQFPKSYNKRSSAFGKLKCVRQFTKGKKATKDTYLRKAPKTKYYDLDCEYKYPEGFIIPIFASLSELMTIKDNKLIWKKEPIQHVKDHLDDWVDTYYDSFIKSENYDPQKCGKNAGIYKIMSMLIENSAR